MSRHADNLLRASFDEHGAKGPDRMGNYGLQCPFCEEREGKVDVKWKLSANPSRVHPGDATVRGAWICWRCDIRGWGGLEFLEEVAPERPKEGDLGPPQGFVPFRGNEDSLALSPYREYVRRREVLEFATAVGAGACLDGRMGGRVVVPHVVGGEWRGFSARAVMPGLEPKYLYPPGMPRRTSLWGLEWTPDDGEPIYVVEGVFDALPLFPYGVATFGKSVTDEQIEMLAAIPRPVVVCLDGDAWTEGRALAARLSMRSREIVAWARLPPGKDPGTLGWSIKQYVQGN
jgi:hypothetical protein